MNTLHHHSAAASTSGPRTMPAVLMIALMGLLTQACSQSHPTEPRSFASPDQAAQALVGAARGDNTQQLRTIMGKGGDQIISSGDNVADRQRRQEFVRLYDQRHSFGNEGPDRVTLMVGDTDWPLPVPIVHRGNGWAFDATAGREEILNRRIGQNELSAIEVCKAIADAQREYALRDPQGHGVHEYAQKFLSDPGQRNGLYWPAASNEEASPLGEFAAQASAEGYTRKEHGPTPYHGYYYRILRAQGPDAPDGELSYVVNGRMTLGFAVVAYPAEYGNSGIMTFIMGPDGTVYQRNLGEDTAQLAGAMEVFNPDPGWTKVR